MTVRIVLAVLLAACVLILPRTLRAQESDSVAIEELAAKLSSVELEQRRDAAYALSKRSGEAVGAIDALVDRLEDSDDQVWTQAVVTIGRIGPPAEKAIEGLVECLGHRDDQRRYRAAWALSKIGLSAIPALSESAGDDSTERRIAAIDAMGWMEEHAEAFLELLNGKLSDEDERVRIQAAVSLARLGKPAMGLLVDALGNDVAEVRVNAARGLGKMSPLGQPASEKLAWHAEHDADAGVKAASLVAISTGESTLPEAVAIIVRSVVDTNDKVRRAALLGLRRLGDEATESIPELEAFLESDDADQRVRAAAALGALGEMSESATPALIRALKAADDGEDAEVVIVSLGRIGPSVVPLLLRASGDPDQSPQRISEAIATMGPAATEPLISSLKDNSVSARLSAARAIAEMKPIPTAAIGLLAEGLNAKSSELRAACIDALSRADAVDPVVIATIRDSVSDDEPAVRGSALRALSRHQVTAETASLIASYLVDDSAEVRLKSVNGLSEIGDAALAHVDQVAALVDDASAEIRRAALTAIGTWGASAKSAVGPVMDALDDENAAVRAAAAVSLGKLGESSVAIVEGLQGRLEDADDQVVAAALGSIEELGHAGVAAFDSVRSLLQSDDGSPRSSAIRSAALKCLASIQSNPGKSVPVLVHALDDSEWSVRREAAESLGKIGKEAKSAVPKLFQMLGSEVEDDKDAARSALRAIDDAGPDALPVLLEGLESEDRRLRFYALFLIGKVGPEAKEALPALKRLRDETDSGRTRGFLQRTIDQIEK